MPPVLQSTPGPNFDRDEETLPAGFGAAVRTARERAGLTKKALSESLAAAGAPANPRTISAWEEKSQRPSAGASVAALERVLGLERDTLLIRLSGAGRPAAAGGRRRPAAPGRFDFATISVSQRVNIDANGRVAFVEATQRIRAMVPGATTYHFRHAEEETERVRVRALSGCQVGNWWLAAQGLMQVQIMPEGGPMRAGEERTFRYRVDHTYLVRPAGPAAPAERRHRGNGTPTLRTLEMEAVFATPGWTVRQCTWINRDADPLSSCPEPVRGLRSRRMEWSQPREHTYGLSWELSP